MGFNDISNDISVILVEETGVPLENQRTAADKHYHIMLYPVQIAQVVVNPTIIRSRPQRPSNVYRVCLKVYPFVSLIYSLKRRSLI